MRIWIALFTLAYFTTLPTIAEDPQPLSWCGPAAYYEEEGESCPEEYPGESYALYVCGWSRVRVAGCYSWCDNINCPSLAFFGLARCRPEQAACYSECRDRYLIRC